MEEHKFDKLKHITLKNDNTQFCLSNNLGIFNFRLDTMDIVSSSELGEIEKAYLYETNQVVFFGSKGNTKYPPDKIVFYNLEYDDEILSQNFENDIKNFKFLDDILIISFDKELKVYLLEGSNLVEKFTEYISSSHILEAWTNLDNDKNVEKLYISSVNDMDVIIFCRSPQNEWKLDTKITIKFTYSKVQNIFYIKKLNSIFVIDEKGNYLYEYAIDSTTPKKYYYRGYNPTKITSITLLNNNYLAVNSINRTIHIFNLNDERFYVFNLLNFFSEVNTIPRWMKIPYSELKGDTLFQSDFEENGAILVGNEENDELTAIAFNGFAYKLKLDFEQKTYKILMEKKFV